LVSYSHQNSNYWADRASEDSIVCSTDEKVVLGVVQHWIIVGPLQPNHPDALVESYEISCRGGYNPTTSCLHRGHDDESQQREKEPRASIFRMRARPRHFYCLVA